jgi:N-hydroxyarylamine O-acetyltransferase
VSIAIDVDGYLARLGVTAPERADAAALRRLQRAHLERVPFHNADVLAGRSILLEPAALVARLAGAEATAGGFCYQLNGAFAGLLDALGFAVEHLPARFHGERLEPRFGHLALRVTVDDGSTWLADVGGGFSFLEPLALVTGLEQDDPNGRFRIVPAAPAPDDGPDVHDVEWRHRDGAFRPHYRFEMAAAPLDAFASTCEWTRTSPESPFTTAWICATALPGGGWATLDDRRLRVRAPDLEPIDETFDDAAALASALERWFGVSSPSSGTRRSEPGGR